MNVGICTCYDNHNYGSMLQAYATYLKFQDMGYTCEFICYKKKLSMLDKIKWLPRLLNKYLMKEKLRLLKKRMRLNEYPKIKEQDAIRQRAYDRFVEKNLTDKISHPYVGYKALQEGSKKYDVVVAGGDQLWIPSGLPTNFYNLMFADENVRRVSYATSFGVTEVPFYQKKRTIRYLNRLDAIGVRERSGAELIRRLTGRDAKVVLDPTLLLTGEEWKQAIPEKKVVEGEYIFCYLLGSNPAHRKAVTELSQKVGLKIYDMPHIDEFVPEDMRFDAQHLYDVDAEQFVNLIRNATYICTDSFHCCAFSIIYHKKFIAFDRYSDPLMRSRNSRITNLCTVTGLESRRFKEDIFTEINEEVDFQSADQNIQKARKESLEYLRNALDNTRR